MRLFGCLRCSCDAHRHQIDAARHTDVGRDQTREKAAFARKGSAYMNDVTFNFNDRENSTKALQFAGSGALETVGSSEAVEIIPLGSYTKGQYVRLFLSSDNTAAPSAVIAAAKQLSLHVSLTLEDASTKDTPGNYQVQEPTGISYDISSTALMRSGETITEQVPGKTVADIEALHEAGTPVKWKIANVTGTNQRTASSTIVSGSVILTTLTLNGPNRANADYTAQMNGYGTIRAQPRLKRLAGRFNQRNYEPQKNNSNHKKKRCRRDRADRSETALLCRLRDRIPDAQWRYDGSFRTRTRKERGR